MSTTKRPAHDRGAARTLSLQPLLDHLRVDNLKAFADRTGYSRRTVYNWLEIGISSDTADWLCITLAKLHPSLVYGRSWAESYDDDFVPGNLKAAARRSTTWATGTLPSSSRAAEEDALDDEDELSDEDFDAGVQFVTDSVGCFDDEPLDGLEREGFDDVLGGLSAKGSGYAVAG